MGLDLQKILDNAVQAKRSEEMKTSQQITLGELILKLETLPPTRTNYKGEEEERRVWFEFEDLHPTGLISWRGSYCELAITFSNHRMGDWDEEAPTLRDFLARLKATIGQTFTGYKGGEYVMGKTTPVWVANYGNSGNTGVVGVRDSEYAVYLLTAWCDY